MQHLGYGPPLLLIASSYASRTRAKYEAAANRFAHWCESRGWRPRTHQQYDFYLCAYLHHLYDECKGKAEGTAAVYGLNMFIPGIKRHIPLTLQSLKGFNRLQPSKQRPPLPWTATVVMAAWLSSRGYLRTAIGILLSFDCYLRPGELMGLRYEDIAIGDDPRLGLEDSDRVHIRLKHTKTGDEKGVEVRHPEIKVLAQILKFLSRKRGQRLLPFSDSTYRRRFKQATTALALSSEYTPHSLRHGGATRDYLMGMPITDVMTRGRWAASKSAQHYIQMGRQLMMSCDIPHSVAVAGQKAVTSIIHTLLLSLSLSSSFRVILHRYRRPQSECGISRSFEFNLTFVTYSLSH